VPQPLARRLQRSCSIIHDVAAAAGAAGRVQAAARTALNGRMSLTQRLAPLARRADMSDPVA